MGAVWLGHGGLYIGYKVVIVPESCEMTVRIRFTVMEVWDTSVDHDMTTS